MPEFLEGTTDLPAVGKIKKVYIMVPAGIAAAYLGWRWYQARQGGQDYDPTATGLYSTDDLSDYGLATTGGGTTVTGNTGNTVTDATGTDTIDSNREWSNKAIELLGNQGFDGQAVAAALGEFLARRALDKDEASIARAALAVAGQPPENGPFSVVEEAGAGTGTLPAPTNLRAWDKPTPSQVGLQWDPVAGAMYYRVFRTDQGDEPMGASADTKFHVKGLQANTSHSFYVRAVGTTGKIGGKSNTIALKTTAVKLARPTGLKASAITKTSFRVTCSKVTGATYYRWIIDGHAAQPTDQPYKDFTGLKAGSIHRVVVYADTTNQEPGPHSATISVKTKK